MWTRNAADLPMAPEWGPCDVKNGDPIAQCKKFQRTGTIEGITAGANLAGKTQIAFVEHCPNRQIVIADADGPTRFALRATESVLSPSACVPNVLAVDLGRWVAALGGSEASDDPEYGKCVGNAVVGGQVGTAPGILFFQTKELYDIRDADGYVTSEGWFASGKKKRWNGKEFDKLEPFDWNFLSEKLLAAPRRGIFVKTETTPQLILPAPEDREVRQFRRREKQLAWIEFAKNSATGSCWLAAGDIDKTEMLVKARRIAKVTCNATYFEIGCNSAIISGDEGAFLVSLADGSSRKLDIKANAMALDCKEAFFKRKEDLFRVELSAFGASQPATEPPVELPISSPTVDADAGAPDAMAPDATVPAPSGSK